MGLFFEVIEGGLISKIKIKDTKIIIIYISFLSLIFWLLKT